jgi:DNA recombination protein RmuC
MTIYEILFAILTLGGLAFLYFRNGKNNTNQVDQLRTEQFIKSAAEAAAKASSETVKKELENFQELQKKDYDLHQEKIGNTLKPVSDSVKDLDRRIEALQKERKEEVGALEGSIKGLLEAQIQLKDETQILSTALTTSSSVRGKWGETMLRNIVERSGLVKYVDFIEQESTQTSDDRPDMLINLPNGGIIPIDAKTPMKEFYDSLNEKNDQIREKMQINFAGDCRKHMVALSRKNYQDQFEGPIDFVIMVIPYEPGYQAALMHDGNLFNDGQDKKVYVVSPITLMPILNLIANTWKQMSLSRKAEEVVMQAQELSKRLIKFDALYHKLGTSITKAGKSYDESVSSYNARLKPAIRNIQNLQGIEEQIDQELKQINLEVKPVLDRNPDDSEE